MNKENDITFVNLEFDGFFSVPWEVCWDMTQLLDDRGFFDVVDSDIDLNEYINSHRVVDVYCQSPNLIKAVWGRFMACLYKVFPNPLKRSRFILRYLIFAFFPEYDMALQVARAFYDRVGLKTIKGNFYMYDITKNSGADKKEVKELMKKVRFNCAVGNPSYKNDLYLEFIKAGHKMASDYSLWITPAKWHMEDDSDFYENMGFDMSEVKFIDKISDVFEDMDLQGRLAYYLCEKNYGEN